MLREKFGRAAIVLLVLLTLGAFADGIMRMAAATTDRIWVETWRTFAYIVFAGLFALLAWRPRKSPGLWELTFAHKVAVVAVGLYLGNAVPEVSIAVKIDLVLVALIVTGWILCRGWLSWAGSASNAVRRS
jgi:hypothetical protein